MDEDDLYGDLELAAKQADLENTQAKLAQVTADNDQLRIEVEQLRAQLLMLVEEKESLEKNCVSIFNTAIREISRKDNEIKELRSQVVRMRDVGNGIEQASGK